MSKMRCAVACAALVAAGLGVPVSSVGAALETTITSTDVAPPLYPYNFAAAGDVTGDGRDDVVHPVLIGLGPSVYSVVVFAGNSEGGFDAGVTTDLPGNGQIVELSVGDMDGDGRADLVHLEELCERGCDYQLTVRPGGAGGSFGDPHVVATLPFWTQTELADLDGDGHLDIAGQMLVDGETPAGWWPNNADGTFGPFQSFNAPYGSVDGVGHFGGGPATDVLLRVEGGAFSWMVVLDPGLAGSTQVTTDLGPGGSVRSIADVDGDGDDDAVYLQYGGLWQFILRLANGDGSFGPPIFVADFAGESDVVLADVDGSGHHDLVVFDANDGMSIIDPEGIDPPSAVVPVDVRLVAIAVAGNFDGAGTEDVVRYSSGFAAGVPDAFKTYRFQEPILNPDLDGDGVLNSIDVGDGAFDDQDGTVGSIVTVPSGLVVEVSDVTDPDGVRVTVTGTAGPTDRVTLSMCGGLTIRLAAGADAVLTCGSIIVSNSPGAPAVEIVILGGSVVVTVPGGSKAEVDAPTTGGYTVETLEASGGAVTVTASGKTTSVPEGQVLARPTDKDQCQNGGWRLFAVPERFKSQGQCTSWVLVNR